MTSSTENASAVVSQKDIDLFISTFKTADSAYAEQYCDKAKGKTTWFRKEKDIDFNRDAVIHLEGGKTIGSYAIHLDGDLRDHCSWCVLDFDIPKKVRTAIEAKGTPEDQAEAFQKELNGIKDTIKQILVSLPQLGMSHKHSLVEFSGNKGYHVWFFFENPIPARNAYLFLNGIKAYYKLDKDLEVFPKQVTSGGAFGNLIKLPLGIHQATGKRCLFVNILQDNTSDTTFLSQFDKLRAVNKINMKLVDDVINQSSMDLPLHVRSCGTDGGDATLDDLSKPPFSADIKEICKKCKALSALETKAKKDGHLVHNERLALLSMYIQFGDKGKKRIHKVISGCSDYEEATTNTMIEHGFQKAYKPITCARLQEWHICKENCTNILKAEGTSPIKFAYKQAKTDLTFTYIEEIELSQCVGKTVRFPFKVTSMVQGGAAYAIDKEIEIICPHTCPERYAEKQKCTYAGGVSKSTDKKVILKIKPDTPFILRSVGAPIEKMKAMEVGMSGVPCIKPKMMRTKVKSHYHVSQILIASSDQVMRDRLFETKKEIECKNFVAYYVGTGGIQTGHEYMAVGRILQHPNDCKLTFIITKIEPLMGSLEEFVPSEEERTQLSNFQSMPPADKVHTIAEQVVGVKGRNMEVLCALLTFFSPLQLKFNGKLLKRGWMETLFIGDSSQGKSHIPEQIMKFAGFNNMIAGTHATEAGVIGGVATVDKQQYISWGMLPRCDKTLVFIDELEALQQKSNVMKSLREVRSSGLATITKIIHGSRLARVRILASANAQKGKTISEYKRGCQSLLDIMEAPDIRRFDLICFFYNDQVNAKEIMKVEYQQDSKITAAEFQTAVRFMWTRTATEVIIKDEVAKVIMKFSRLLHEKYQGAIQTLPIIALDVFQKVARVAAGFAGFAMNTPDFKNIIVTEDHAKSAYELIDGIYSDSKVALHEEAAECILKNEVTDAWFAKFEKKVKHSEVCRAVNTTQALIHLNSIDKTRGDDFAYYLQANKQTAVKFLQFLTVEKLVEAEVAGGYKPTSKLYKLVHALSSGERTLDANDSEQQAALNI